VPAAVANFSEAALILKRLRQSSSPRDVAGKLIMPVYPIWTKALHISAQLGDRPNYDGLLALFPKHYHEPYYSTYISEKFDGLAEASGLTQVRHFNAFVSKVMVFDKPGERSPRASGCACPSISTAAKA
jgi:hypothetical protein